jgi:hypothetical protein
MNHQTPLHVRASSLKNDIFDGGVESIACLRQLIKSAPPTHQVQACRLLLAVAGFKNLDELIERENQADPFDGLTTEELKIFAGDLKNGYEDDELLGDGEDGVS